MSGYEKNSAPPHDYDSRPSQIPTSPTYNQGLQQALYSSYTPSQHFGTSQALSTSPPQLQTANVRDHTAQVLPSLPLPLPPYQRSILKSEQQPLLGEPVYTHRPYNNNPQAISYEPRSGNEGIPFVVYLQSVTDLMNDGRTFRVVFGSRRCISTLKKSRSQQKEYQLSTFVPDFKSTGWTLLHVKVYVLVEGPDGHEIGLEPVGTFSYTNIVGASSQMLQSNYESSRRNLNPLKRKSVGDIEEAKYNPAKRLAMQQPLRPKSEDYGPYGGYATASQYSAYSPTTTDGCAADRSYGVYSSYDQVDSPQSYHHPHASPRHFAYPYGTASEASHQHPTQQTWQSQFSVLPEGGGPSATSIAAAAAEVVAAASVTASDSALAVQSPSHVQNPTLIRTSTLQNIDKGGEGGSASGRNSGGGGFNPYSIYPHRAILEIQGDLDDMAKRWSAEEWGCKRRLVQFWRKQKGNTIHTTFRPVPQSDQPSSAICVSCIWWAERNDCFVTSVDCISLLESLVAVRFTVEEKNRIRRNLEGFRPLTVSKGRKESEDFFKLIMQFPSPKPRNIEKDVKVFPWSILPLALKKIIGKYSASYSSTASIIAPNPSASPYPGTPSHEHSFSLGLENESQPPPPPPTARPMSSPAIIDHPLASTTPSTGAVTSTLSPLNRGTDRTNESHTSLPNILGTQPIIWPQQQSSLALQGTSHALASRPQHTHPHHRSSSWDVTPYLDGMPPTSTSSYFQRGDERVVESSKGTSAAQSSKYATTSE